VEHERASLPRSFTFDKIAMEYQYARGVVGLLVYPGPTLRAGTGRVAGAEARPACAAGIGGLQKEASRERHHS